MCERDEQPAMRVLTVDCLADHATNVAEDVIYMVLGRDIRHRAEERVLPK